MNPSTSAPKSEMTNTPSNSAGPKSPARIPRIPRFITAQFAGGAQEYRVSHRHALRQALKALRLARMGCAYSPAYRFIQRANDEVDKAIEATRPGNWERRNQRRKKRATP
jgi:hypothetical protein